MIAVQTHAKAPTHSTVHRLPQKRIRQQGRLLVSREITDLVTHVPRIPQNQGDAISIYKP